MGMRLISSLPIFNFINNQVKVPSNNFVEIANFTYLIEYIHEKPWIIQIGSIDIGYHKPSLTIRNI